jgi:hypothetical protein
MTTAISLHIRNLVAVLQINCLHFAQECVNSKNSYVVFQVLCHTLSCFCMMRVFQSSAGAAPAPKRLNMSRFSCQHLPWAQW